MTPSVLALMALCAALFLVMGFGVADNLAEGASLKNLLLYGLLIFNIRRIGARGGDAIAPMREIQRAFAILAFWVLVSSFAAFGRGLPLPAVVDVAKTWKAEFLDSFVMLVLVSALVRSAAEAKAALRFLVVGVAMLAALTVVEAAIPGLRVFGMDIDAQFLDPDYDDPLAALGRPKGPFGEPNQSAAVLATVLPMAISLALARGRGWVIFAGACLALTAGILATGSRGGLAAATAGVLVLLFLMRGRLGIGGKLLLLLSVPLFGFVAWIALPDTTQQLMTQRLASVFDRSVNVEVASAGRTVIWTAAIERWLKEPLLGVGWGGFRSVFHGATHSEYLRYLVDTGIIGLALLLRLFWTVVRGVRRVRLLDPFSSIVRAGTIGSITALVVSVAFVTLHQPWLIVWCFLGCAVSFLIFAEGDARRRRDQLARSRARQDDTGSAIDGDYPQSDVDQPDESVQYR